MKLYKVNMKIQMRRLSHYYLPIVILGLPITTEDIIYNSIKTLAHKELIDYLFKEYYEVT